MKYFFIATFLLVMGSMTSAQIKNLDISQRVSLGEEIPKMSDMDVLYHGTKRINLQQYDDRVLLLDFFDTYCSACIASLPKLQKLQNEMGNRVKIVLVSWQDSGTLNKFWKNNHVTRSGGISMPIVYSDTVLRRYFPHQAIPHVVWIKDRLVKAITHSDFVNHDNLSELLHKGEIELPLKQDFVVESHIVPESSENVIGSVKLTGFLDARPVETFKLAYDSLAKAYKTSFYNMSVLGAYTSTWSKIRKPTFLLRPNRIVWNVPDSSKFEYFGKDGEMQLWLSKHGICYERYDRVQRPMADQAKIVMNDLNNMLGLKVYWAERNMPALVIKGNYSPPKEGSVPTTDGSHVEGTAVLAFLLDMSGSYPPVVDRAKVKERLFIRNYSNLEELNAVLGDYGLFVEEETAEVEVLVVEDANKKG